MFKTLKLLNKLTNIIIVKKYLKDFRPHNNIKQLHIAY